MNSHLCVSSTHTPDHSHSRPWSESALYMFWEMLALDLQFLPCQIHGMAAMNSAAPAFFLPNLWVRLLTLLPEGASEPGSCACVSESGDRKWGRVWCHPPPKFTILVMAVNTNFLVGLQRLRKDFFFFFNFISLRKDFYSRTDFDHKPLLFPFHSEEPNLSFAFWHFWGWWS